MKKTYKTPELVDHGSVTPTTLESTPGVIEDATGLPNKGMIL
jgi:hypothetical protein